MAFGHKRGGTKVSGAKLKPAIPPPPVACPAPTTGKGNSRKGKEKEARPAPRLLEEEEDDQYDRTFMESIRNDRPPLTGCVVCLSGISEPVRVCASQTIAYAEKLGARIEKALTKDVTHLICDRPGSEKYNVIDHLVILVFDKRLTTSAYLHGRQVALQHSIRVMLPLWLTTLYSSFTEGEDIDLHNITKRYTMKPLQTLKLAFTGKASCSRTPFIKLAEDNGATVSIDLEIDCSHLVVLSLVPPNETDPTIFEIEKVQAARKANNIKVVWQEWLEDSVQRQGSLPEAPYLLMENVPRPGRLALPDSESANDAALDPKELARAMQGDKMETAVTRKTINSSSQNAIMASIILRQDLPIRRHPSNLSFKSADAEHHRNKLEEELPQIFQDKTTLSEQLPCSNASGNSSSVLHPFLKDITKTSGPASIVKMLQSAKSKKFGNPASSPNGTEATSHRIVPGLFRGLKISSAGCIPNHQRMIATLVTQCGGQFTELHSTSDYTVVPLINPPFIPPGSNPVGHHWVEQSLFERKIIDPDQHWSGRPVRLEPFPNPEQYTFSSCGFTSVEEHIIQQVLKKLELKYIPHPRRSEVSHFFVGPVEGSSRVDKVKSWYDKVKVDFEWLVQKCNGKRISRSVPTTSLARATRSPPESIHPQYQDNANVDIIDTPLSECVLFLTRKGSLHPNSKCLADCRKLGARVVDKLSETVTHVVHAADRTHDPLRELKWARSKNLYIVHPYWLSECKTKLIKADELAFPATYNPQRALTYCVPSSAEITMADVSCNSIPDQAITTTTPGKRQAYESSDLILEHDETFFISTPSRAPTVPMADDTLPAPIFENNFEQMEEKAADFDERPNDRPNSSHHATSPLPNIFPTSSSPSCHPIPRVDTQLGGFMEILQQRNCLVDLSGKVKEKDSRKSRKRGLEDSARGSAKKVTDESHESGPMGNGLNRTMSEFSHSSAAASQIGGGGFLERNSFEESMDVTWEDPAAKREILKAINDPTGKKISNTRRTASTARRHPPPRKASLGGGAGDPPAPNLRQVIHRDPSRTIDPNHDDPHLSKKSRPGSKNKPDLILPHDAENLQVVANDLNIKEQQQDEEEEEIVVLPPLKKRRPRLIDK
ncbi:hypothetical protein VP01_526g9 [Puccinia sorghi]|uniref:BRCT domain-containing protein n=1 Tax=Puccinia sorghi TaxID=27349 RepID=A0A0L6UKD9_9BASI|nr:hypothetical protein VP01_526g9 [Puccinia sorghi]